MITLYKIREFVRRYLDQEALTKIIIVLALITGIIIGYNFTGKFIEKDCNDFIIDNYIIPRLEALGYTIIDRKIIDKNVDTSLFNLTFDLPFGEHDFYDENNNDSG